MFGFRSLALLLLVVAGGGRVAVALLLEPGHGPNATGLGVGVQDEGSLTGTWLDQYHRTWRSCECKHFESMKLTPRHVIPPRNTKAKTVMVIVCEHQHYMLSTTLACNKPLVDHIIVLTSPSDWRTKAVCLANGIEVRETDDLHLNGDPFNKGRALASLQEKLHLRPDLQGATLILLDNDICLPSNFWYKVPMVLKDKTLYSSVDRCMFSSLTDFSRGFPAVQAHWNQYETLGFFQMYKINSSATLPVYEPHSKAGGDTLFGMKFHRNGLKGVKTLPVVLNHIGGVGGKWRNWGGIKEADVWDKETQIERKWAVPPPDGSCPCCPDEDFPTGPTISPVVLAKAKGIAHKSTKKYGHV